METTNRVLTFLQPTCRCHAIKRRLAELNSICAPIKEACDNVVWFFEPDAAAVLETGEETELGLIGELKFASCTISDDIALHAVCELRRVADKLIEAADRIEDAELDGGFRNGGAA